MWYGIGVASVVMCAGTLLLLDAGLPGGVLYGAGDVPYARTLAFHVLVLYQLFAVFTVRSDEASALRNLFANPWLWLSVAACVALQCAVLYVPPLQRGFGTVALGPGDWVACAAVASTVVVARELLKARFRALDAAARRVAARLAENESQAPRGLPDAGMPLRPALGDTGTRHAP
jgi:Ca2+-transporting ATPase